MKNSHILLTQCSRVLQWEHQFRKLASNCELVDVYPEIVENLTHVSMKFDYNLKGRAADGYCPEKEFLADIARAINQTRKKEDFMLKYVNDVGGAFFSILCGIDLLDSSQKRLGLDPRLYWSFSGFYSHFALFYS